MTSINLTWDKEKKDNIFGCSIAPTMNQSACSSWLYFAGFHFISGWDLTMSSLSCHYSHLRKIPYCAHYHWNVQLNIRLYPSNTWVHVIWCKILLGYRMRHVIVAVGIKTQRLALNQTRVVRMKLYVQDILYIWEVWLKVSSEIGINKTDRPMMHQETWHRIWRQNLVENYTPNLVE